MIVGCIRVCEVGLLTAPWSLPWLEKICDRVCLLLHGVNIWQLRRKYPVKKWSFKEWKEPFDQGATLTAAFHLADEYKPDWIIMPDSDEILPMWEFRGCLAEHVLHCAEGAGKSVVSFPHSLPYLGFDRQIDPATVTAGAHVKAVKWDKDILFEAPGGFCMPYSPEKPKGYWDDTYACKSPLLHLCFLSREITEARRTAKTSRPMYLYTSPDGNPNVVSAPKEWEIFQNANVKELAT